jgi:hypothetical protein
MCFVRAWKTGLEAKAIAPMLSHHKFGVVGNVIFKSWKIIRSQYNSAVA